MKSKEQWNELTPEESFIIVNKGTENPFSGKYNEFQEDGVYLCKRCEQPLYQSKDKFSSNCGWPSFEDEIQGAIEKRKDTDGMRIEILCKNCGAHLGHVFYGEQMTIKNTRHCVNSLALMFVPKL